MAKRIVNRSERNAERYEAKEVYCDLYTKSEENLAFERLMPIYNFSAEYYSCVSKYL